MISLFRKVQWWLQRRRKEEELREELQFHLAEEMDERQADGLPADEALGGAARPGQRDAPAGRRTHACGRGCCSSNWRRMSVTACAACSRTARSPRLATLSLALGIGANTAIYSFMDSILLRALPVADPASLVVVKWQSGPVNRDPS